MTLANLMADHNDELGEIYVELYWSHAPKTCNNFYELTKRGYYSNTKFHRLIKEAIRQAPEKAVPQSMGTSTLVNDKDPYLKTKYTKI
ncbi:hypothetical protein MXB_2120 [Myxobolus squamalis]|nr:hypothetical protein MXB_2120 [Myxobolus squamalis]